MNRYHQRRCRSPEWAAHMAGTVLPRALDGLALGTGVLELGPGYGATTRPLMERAGTGATVTALEKDPQLAGRLRAGLDGRATVVTGDATGMPFEAGAFTAVVCFTMLHHLPSAAAQDRMFAEAARVLRPGGVFAGVDSLRSLRFRLIHLADTCTPVDPGTLPGRLAAAGFRGVEVDSDGRRLWFRAQTPVRQRGPA